MQAQVTPLDGSKAIGITFADKSVTVFGGVVLFVAFAERIGLAGKLAEALLGADRRPPPLRLFRARPWQATCLASLSRLLPRAATCHAVAATEANR